MNFAHAYASIVKYDRHDDGTLTVYGKATDDSLDIDQQICDDAWLDRAMPEWFKSGGNIREQHSSIAAGVAQEYEKKSDGHYISALVVDPVSVKKVESRVLKGFSIGIKSPRVVRDQKAANGRIIDGQIVEVSLVDRPANPNAKLMLAKSLEGDIVQVEEYTETPSLLDTVKSFRAELEKFDQSAFDTARRALADLIAVEAAEMSEQGHDERESIKELLDSIKHLFHWYEGEVEEGEVAEPLPLAEEAAEEASEDVLELAADPETPAEDGAETDEEKMCKECGETLKLCKCNDKSADPDEAVETADETSAVDSVEEDADKSAETSVLEEEVVTLRAAIEAAEAKAAGLEAQLTEALNKAVAGGPKRTAKTSPASLNDVVVKAAQYRAKAAAATDPLLAKGYREMADDLEAKLTKSE